MNSPRTDKQHALGKRREVKKPVARNGVLDAGNIREQWLRPRCDENVVRLDNLPRAKLNAAWPDEPSARREVSNARLAEALEVARVQGRDVGVAFPLESRPIERRRAAAVIKAIAGE